MYCSESLEVKLKSHGYKLTNQRKAIIEVLLEHKDQFLSAQDIYSKSKELQPDTNFSTIYRNLIILEDTGIIHNTSFNGNTSMYELVLEDNHHHHIICKVCGKTEIIDFCPLENAVKNLQSSDFTLTGHKFEIYGYCKNCKKCMAAKK